MGKTDPVEQGADLAIRSVPCRLPKVLRLLVGIEAGGGGRPVGAMATSGMYLIEDIGGAALATGDDNQHNRGG